MALIHTDADIHPGKLELLSSWLPEQDWGSGEELERVATFRLDDPAGEVGMESFVLRAGHELLHVPLTYRGAPLEHGALVGEMEHTALGHRWVYDAATDPVYVETVTRVIVEAGQHAVLVDQDGNELPPSETSASARGSGVAAGTTAGPLEVVRRPAAAVERSGAAGVLTATWSGQSEPQVLVALMP